MDFIELLVRELDMDRRQAKSAAALLFIGSFAVILLLMGIKAIAGQPIFNGWVICVGFALLLVLATIFFMKMGPEGDVAYVSIEKVHKFVWGWLAVMADAVLAVAILPFEFGLCLAIILAIIGWYSSAEILRRVFNWDYYRLTNIGIILVLLAAGMINYFGFGNLGEIHHDQLGGFFMKTFNGLVILLGLIITGYGIAKAISEKGTTMLVLGAAILLVGGVINANWGDIGIKDAWEARKAKAEAATPPAEDKKPPEKNGNGKPKVNGNDVPFSYNPDARIPPSQLEWKQKLANGGAGRFPESTEWTIPYGEKLIARVYATEWPAWIKWVIYGNGQKYEFLWPSQNLGLSLGCESKRVQKGSQEVWEITWSFTNSNPSNQVTAQAHLEFGSPVLETQFWPAVKTNRGWALKKETPPAG